MFIQASQQFLERFENVKFESLQGASARKTVLVVGIMAAHALGEGSGVGVSFCGHRGWAQARPPRRPPSAPRARPGGRATAPRRARRAC
jgi:hypothetical protein